jgi:CRISPR-associated exonuclease Cas4
MEIKVSGTHLWYYTICKRQVWLISRQITPDQEDDNLLLGRYIDRESYRRLKRSLIVDNNKIDVFFHEEEKLVVAEVEKFKAIERAKSS